jgi:hypothetical protein
MRRPKRRQKSKLPGKRVAKTENQGRNASHIENPQSAALNLASDKNRAKYQVIDLSRQTE